MIPEETKKRIADRGIHIPRDNQYQLVAGTIPGAGITLGRDHIKRLRFHQRGGQRSV
jgi:hypothetical protein